MAEGASFTIDIAAKAAGVDQAAAAVDALAARLTAAETAASQAAEALAAGETAYAQAEAGADRAAKAVERMGVQSDALKAKMAAALEAGDEKRFYKLADAANELAQRQDEAAKVAAQAQDALAGEARALEGLRVAAKHAADGQADLVKAHEQSRSALERSKAVADKFRKSQGGMADSAERAFGGLKKLGGPLGQFANTAEDTIEGFGKLSQSVGLVGTVALGATVGVLALAAAAGVAAMKIGEVAFWAVKLADKEKRLDKIQEKFKKHTTGLFGGLKIEKLLDGFESLVDLFDETTESGRAIKVVFESLFQPLIDGIVAWIPKMRSAFIQFEILVLKALIAIKPYGSQILMVAQVLGILAAVVVGVVVAAFAVGIAIAVAFWTAMIKISEVTTAAYTTLIEFGKGVWDFFASLDLASIGTSIVQGLIAGIMGAGPALISSLGGVVTGAIDAAKGLLGIASPSKVFEQIGAYTAEGMALGVEGGAPAVQGSLESMASAPEAGGAGGESSGGGGDTFNITINASGDAKDIAAEVERVIIRAREGLLMQAGAAVPT